MQRLPYGFTLIESLMVAAIGATLAMLALPAVSALAADESPADLLARDLRDARRLAVLSGERLTLCPLEAGSDRCSAGGVWSHGWRVQSATPAGAAAEPLLQRAIPAAAGMRVERLDVPVDLAIGSDGALQRADGALAAARWKVEGNGARWVCLSPAGNAQVTGEGAC